MWFLFVEVFSSSGCLGWATLFYCGTPWAFHIIIIQGILLLLMQNYDKIVAMRFLVRIAGRLH